MTARQYNESMRKFGIDLTSDRNLRNFLIQAVENNNIALVRELLLEGVDPNLPFVEEFMSCGAPSPMRISIMHNNIEMIKLLVKHGAIVFKNSLFEDDLMDYILEARNRQRSIELLTHVIKFTKDEDHKREVLGDIFVRVTESSKKSPYNGEQAVEIIDLLLNNGLSLDGYLKQGFTMTEDSYTPLHAAILHNRMEMVKFLLKRGADINQKTKKGNSSLGVSLWHCEESMVKFLLKKGVSINERTNRGKTALHRACGLESHCTEAIRVLFKYGADPNILDDRGRLPLDHLEHDGMSMTYVLELSKFMMDGQIISKLNYQRINEMKEKLKNTFRDSSKELQQMKSHEIWNNVSVYDIFKMEKRERKKLIRLMKIEDFVKAFKTSCDSELFEFYAEDLNEIFKNALKSRDALLKKEKKSVLNF